MAKKADQPKSRSSANHRRGLAPEIAASTDSARHGCVTYRDAQIPINRERVEMPFETYMHAYDKIESSPIVVLPLLIDASLNQSSTKS